MTHVIDYLNISVRRGGSINGRRTCDGGLEPRRACGRAAAPHTHGSLRRRRCRSVSIVETRTVPKTESRQRDTACSSTSRQAFPSNGWLLMSTTQYTPTRECISAVQNALDRLSMSVSESTKSGSSSCHCFISSLRHEHPYW